MEENEFQDGTYLPRTTIRFSRKSQVMTIAATESGIHILMCIIMTIEIVNLYEEDKRNDLQFIMFWTFFYFNHVICAAASAFLYVFVSKWAVHRIKLYLKITIPIYLIWILTDVWEARFMDAHILVSTLIIAVALYKLVSFITVYLFVHRQIKFLKSRAPLSDSDIESFENGNDRQCSEFPGECYNSLPYNKHFEIHAENLSLESTPILGAGAFGQVLKGALKVETTGETLTVAVKIVNPNADGCYFRSLLSELKILTYIGQHEHIVNLIGACTSEIRQKKILIAIEFCAYGSVDTFIFSRRGFFRNMIVNDQIISYSTNYRQLPETVTTLDILLWTYQTATGMAYLSSKKIIHGDLAARNILLTENKSIKIADFGLSRYLFQKLNYIKKGKEPLPWRWMAVESLCSREFSSKSDVWSFAVAIWEFFTLAELPFLDFNVSKEFVDKVKNGLRLRQPTFCTAAIYQQMCSCWEIDPNNRPDFQNICEFFKRIIATTSCKDTTDP